MDSSLGELLYLLLFIYQAVHTYGAHHMHLGCYRMAEPGADSDGLKYHYAHLEIGTCAAGCNHEGYPYIALQKGKHCLCVSEFGKGGLTFGSACTEMCYSDLTFACGGEETENVYYAVDTDRHVVDERTEIVKTTSLTFHEARKECVRVNGDLVTIRDIFQLDRLLVLANQSGVGEPFWIGMSQSKWGRARRWTVPNMFGLDTTDSSMFWDTGHPLSDKLCTVMDPSTSKWRSTECTESHPFVCHQIPPPLTPPPEVTDPPTTTPDPFPGLETEDQFWTENQLYILYGILPLFIFCYGGSCISYTIYKGYKACKKKTKRKARENYPRTILKQNVRNNSEPLLLAPEPVTSKSRPITPREIMVNENEIKPPPYSKVPGPSRKRSGTPTKPNEEPEPEKPEIDFTRLSIADILYIRTMLGMNPHRTKKKKILTT